VNRRGNGLSADTYAPLIDLTGELADAMLMALGQAGVAAYATSRTAGTAGEPASEAPLDRVFVDTSMRSIAERVLTAQIDRLREELALGSGTGSRPVDPDPTATPSPAVEAGPGTAERDDDAVWAEIVASFESSPEDGARPWPDQEDIDETRGEQPPEGEGHDREGRLPTARLIKPAGRPEAVPGGGSGDTSASDDDGHYVPPTPPPLPSGDTVARSAWAALLGGPLYLLLTVLLGWEVPGWAAFTAVAAFIGGFVTLVLRMGDDPPGPDDGAVV
jgi:hypothetical protein